ncbi:uncharacterized protein RJT20DRAFT_54201 [Scheffersomyces xylosifermentans]|uniref:uncharacterized protein n=1 Tax=Scheffersomyces xylosifermentans TaxID=1304137 RepID=UPI00315D6A1C
MSSHRRIRKQPFLSKLKSLPFDFFLYVNEIRLSIEWDEYIWTIALPLGAILTTTAFIIQAVLQYYNSINSKSSNALFSSDYYAYERLKSSLSSSTKRKVYIPTKEEVPITTTFIWLLNSISTIILIASILNTIRIFTAKRTYSLIYCKKKPSSSSVIKTSLRSISVLSQWLYLLKGRLLEETPGPEETLHDETEENIKNDDEIWQLNVWDPSKFSIYVFITLNPVNLFIAYLTNVSTTASVSSGILLVIAISVMVYFIISKFLDLVNDKQILYQEMFQEYNDKFVKPKTNILKKDALIDATHGPYLSSVLVDERPYVFNKSRLFVTHDLKGNQVNEYVGTNEDAAIANSSDRIATLKNTSIIRDSSRVLNHLRHDNEELRVKNEQLSHRLANVSGAEAQRQRFPFLRLDDELDDEEEEEDRNWYTSSTPYSSRVGNRDDRNLREFNTLQSVGKEPSLHPFTPRHQSPSFLNRSPSPMREFLQSPTPNRPNGRSPSPIRSPTLTNRSNIGRISPTKQSLGFQQLAHTSGMNQTSFRSPSPTKNTSSHSPNRLQSPYRQPPESPKPKWR